MAEVVSAAVQGGRSIGRYFVAIAMVPSLLFVLYIYALVAAGAWPGPFQPAKAFHTAEHLGLVGIAALFVAALLLGLVLHPFQFFMTQALEGYWGKSRIGLRLARRRIIHYRHFVQDLRDKEGEAREAWQSAIEGNRPTPKQRVKEPPEDRLRRNRLGLDSRRGDPMLADYLRAEAAGAACNLFPEAGRRIMPTRLGNVLRRHETRVGQQYGLDVLRVAPHLNLVAIKEHRDYVDDCRKGLDLTVRLCVLFLVATALSVILLVRDGGWLLLSFFPYCVSYLAYRGAVASAEAYGTALSALVDLNRFALYDALHLPYPSDILAEQKQNKQLLGVLSNEPPYSLRYADPLNPWKA